MSKLPDQPDALLRQMASLADTTRLRLLCLLERQELGVSDLCEVLQMPQSTVSRHLKLLGDEGWLVSRRQGTINFYRCVLEELPAASGELWRLAREQTRGWATSQQDEVRLAERLRERRKDAQAFFAGAAEAWDSTRGEIYGPFFGKDAAIALLPPDWVVADLGCGTGTITADLARSVRRVIGVDNSQAMLDAARQRTGHLPNVDLRMGDLEQLPLENGHCDAALMVLVLAYLPDLAGALAEMRRVLRPGGRAVVVDLLRHDREDFRRQMGQVHQGFEPEELAGHLARAGFSQPQARPLPPVPQATGPALLLATATA